MGWTNIDAMAEETLGTNDAINLRWPALPGRRLSTTYPTSVLVRELTVTFPTLVVQGESFWDSIASRLFIESHGDSDTRM